MRFCCHAQMCLWFAYTAHVMFFCCLLLHESQIRYAHNGRSDICVLRNQNRSTFIGMYDQHCYWHCRCFRLCLWNSRKNWNKWVMCNNRSTLLTCDTWAIKRYEITCCMGRDFVYCREFIVSCRWPWFCRVYALSSQSQRSRPDEVMFANGILVNV